MVPSKKTRPTATIHNILILFPVIILLVSSLFLGPNATFAEQAEITLKDNNIDGGGFQSDVAITENGLIIYSAADVSGVFKSTDGGRRFANRNEGLVSRKVASIAITPDNPEIVYAAIGNHGDSGGLVRSIDGGDRWILTAEGGKSRFAGNHASRKDPLVHGHPRSNGNLIVVDSGEKPDSYLDDIILTGSYKSGIHLYMQGGEKHIAAVNKNGFVRELAHHPANPHIAYAAIQFSDTARNGIYRIDYKNPAKPISTLVYATLRPEGLSVLSNGHVYGAIGDKGIVRFDGNTWSSRSSGLSVNEADRIWSSVVGYVGADSDIVYAGVNNIGGHAGGKNYSNIWRSIDSGKTWDPLVNADSNVSDKIYGKSQNWWFSTKAFRQAKPGRKNSVVSSIAVAKGASETLVSDDIIIFSGRGGLWRTDNGGRDWQPTVNNMQATSNSGVAVNLNNPQQVVLANTDYVVLESGSAFQNRDISRDKPKGSASKGYDVVFDAKSNELILGTGKRDTNNPGRGEVYVKPASELGVSSGSGWRSTNLRMATSSSQGRVRAVTRGYHDGRAATSQVILAAVEGEGVFRLHKGKWTRSEGVNIGSTNRSRFVWPENESSGVVYLLDLSSGFYRSNDGGKSWRNIWPEMRLRNKKFYNTGYIAADKGTATTLYLSIQGDKKSPIGSSFKVYRLTDADTRIFGKPGTAGITDITNSDGHSRIQRPGPLAVAPDGSLWLTQQQDARNQIDSALFVMRNPAVDKSFRDVTIPEYRNFATSPSGIDISGDGHIYISQNGNGLVKLFRNCHTDNSC